MALGPRYIDPTPEQIAIECRLIQATWDADTEASRRGCRVSESTPYTIPESRVTESAMVFRSMGMRTRRNGKVMQ